MIAEHLVDWLGSAQPVQREKLAMLRARYIDVIRDLDDVDHLLVIREIKKRLKSPKLAGEVAALIAELERDRVAKPRAVVAVPTDPEPPSPPPTNPLAEQLEALIAQDPERAGNYVPYGDLLEARNDPRGALVTIGQELAKNPGNKAMLNAHEAHLAEHGKAILGELVDCTDVVSAIEWYMGFIKKCHVGSTLDRFNDGPKLDIGSVITWLVDDPGPARFLQHLVVGMVSFEGNTYQPVIDALARKRRTLRTLYLGDFESDETELNWSTIGNLEPLWPMVPDLRELTLRSGSMTIGAIDLPRLEKLRTITGGLDSKSVAHIAAASWPSLREVSLQIGLGREGACTEVGVIAPLIEGSRLPKLQELGILNCEFIDEICERLATSQLLPQVSLIDLSMGTMSDRGAEIIHQHRAAFAHVKLIVDDNYLTDAARPLLEASVASLVFGDQRDDDEPDDRHASAYE